MQTRRQDKVIRMEGAEDSPSSLWMIRAAELFPKEEIEKEDNKLQIPFNECESINHQISEIKIIFFSAWRTHKLLRKNREWHSRLIQLPNIPVKCSETLWGIHSVENNRDSANKGNFHSYHQLQRCCYIHNFICNNRELFRMAFANNTCRLDSRTVGKSVCIRFSRVHFRVTIHSRSGSLVAESIATRQFWFQWVLLSRTWADEIRFKRSLANFNHQQWIQIVCIISEAPRRPGLHIWRYSIISGQFSKLETNSSGCLSTHR